MSVQGDQTKEKILAAALKVFAQKGYDGATTRDIAAEAKQQLFTITYHFTSKKELYAKVIDCVVENVSASSVVFPVDEQPPPEEAKQRLLAIVGNMVRGSLSKEAYANGKLILLEQYVPTENFPKLSKNLLEPMQNGIAHFLAGAVGRYELATAREFQLYSHTIHSMSLSFRVFQNTLKSRTGIAEISEQDIRQFTNVVTEEVNWIVDGLRAKYSR